jgi:glycosyltransferase involved in cell wall biosynthesis
MKISAAICTYNRAKFLEKSLTSLIKQNFDKNDYEIIVIDNNSNDNTKEVVNKFIEKYKDFNIKYVFEPVQGLSIARNRAIKEANSNILLFIDDDAIANENLLKEHLRIYNEFENVSCVGGKILLDFVNGKPAWLDEKFYKFYGYLNISDKIIEINNSPYGGNISINLKIVKEKDIEFDKSLGRNGNILNGGEEVLFCETLIKYGFKIYYNPYAVVYHLISKERTNYKYLINNVRQGANSYFHHLYNFQKKSKIYIIFLSLYNLAIYLLSFLKNLLLFRKNNIFYIYLYLLRFFYLFKICLKGEIK